MSVPSVTTRITPAQLKQLDKWARKHKTTRAAALRQAVDEFVYTVAVRGTTADVPASSRAAAISANERGDYATALREFRVLAAQGHADAQYALGVMYGNGEGVPQDYAEAARWYRKAADQGFAASQNNLGAMYGEGWGVTQDNVQAYMWFDLAASQLPSALDVAARASAIFYRDHVAAVMTPAQIAEAQKLARERKPK